MAEVETHIADLEHAAAAIRVNALEYIQGQVEALTALWNQLNDYAATRPALRSACDDVAADIALFEKFGFALDTEWLAESKREHAAAADDQAPADS